MIMHLDMDAFFASIEQRINPALKGQPVIVGARDNKYATVVCAASYEAKAYGITSGMPSRKAFTICPHAKFVACDSAKYAHISSRILEILSAEFSPFVTRTSIDEFTLNTNGLNRIFGSPETMAESIKKRILETFDLTCSIGVAPTWILAKLGSDLNKPDGFLKIDASNIDTALRGLAVSEICGIGPSLSERLKKALAVKTCDQLKAVPQTALLAYFGQSTGTWLYRAVRCGQDAPAEHTSPSKLHDTENYQHSEEPPKSIGHSYTLPKETTKQEIIFAYLRLLSEMVAERVRKDSLWGRTVSVDWSSRKESFAKQKTFLEPTNDGFEIFRRSAGILGLKNGKIHAVRCLGITLSGLTSDNHLPLLTEQKKREALLGAIDRINSKLGNWGIFPASICGIGGAGCGANPLLERVSA